MEKKLVILLLGVLIVGLAAGFILSFIVYQPQIIRLRNDLSSLEDEITSHFAENQESLSNLGEAISDIDSALKELNSTFETTQEDGEETKFESLEIQEAQATSNETHFEINFLIKNSGTTSAALILLFLDQYPIQYLPDVTLLVLNNSTISHTDFFTWPIAVGASVEGNLTLIKGLVEGLNLQSDTTVQLKFTSAQRYEYFTSVYLP